MYVQTGRKSVFFRTQNRLNLAISYCLMFGPVQIPFKASAYRLQQALDFLYSIFARNPIMRKFSSILLYCLLYEATFALLNYKASAAGNWLTRLASRATFIGCSSFYCELTP
jgi:hypothetical protein